jgi:hypothetical protein
MNGHHRKSSAVKEEEKIDLKTIQVCNDLMETKIKTTQLSVERETEYRHAIQEYNSIHRLFQESCKPSSNNIKKVSLDFHTKGVASVFLNDYVDDNHQHQQQTSPSSPSISITTPMSPFLLSQTSQLCYHVHLMTLVESIVPKIHEDYRQVVNWIHEYWEELDRETQQFKQKIIHSMNEQKQQRHRHKIQGIQIQQNYQKEKILILKDRISTLQQLMVEERLLEDLDIGEDE